MARLRVLTIAVATGRIGYVFFHGGEISDWAISRTASASPPQAIKQVEKWVARLQPDVVITEDLGKMTRKGQRVQRLITAIAKTTNDMPLSDIVVRRTQRFKNKYEEAEALATIWPDLLPLKPRRPRLWEPEPRNMVYFEAVTLAMEVVTPPQTT